MIESILDSIKKMLSIAPEDTNFDSDIITHINSVFMILHQLGIGPDAGYSINDKEPKWSDYVLPSANVEGLKSYMYLRVKALFDPAGTSFTLEAFQKQCDEFEWRLVLQKESGELPSPP